MLIDQDKLDAARAALGALTETETVDAALDLVVFRSEVFGALDRIATAGGLGVTPRTPPRSAKMICYSHTWRANSAGASSRATRISTAFGNM
jgi:hypothetical protein